MDAPRSQEFIRFDQRGQEIKGHQICALRKWQVAGIYLMQHIPARKLTQSQILFYANAGQQKEGSEGGFISLFLSCEVCNTTWLSGCWHEGH